MFLVVPVENKPSWKSPPWATILLILLNVVIYFGWQVPEEPAVEKAAEQYAQTVLPPIEMPLFVKHLDAQAKKQGSEHAVQQAKMATELLQERKYEPLYLLMWHETRFRVKLLAEQVVLPSDENYAQWRAARTAFNRKEPAPFTTKWAQDFDSSSLSEILQQPHTLFTSTFLHGSFDHLLGNMVALFVFGFALELALGTPIYLSLYLLCGIGSSLVAALAYGGSGNYGLGASGAISGLMGMYAVLYRLRRIKFFYWILFYFNYARLPALLMLPVWMGHELLQHYLAGGNVSYMAHFGGLACGAIMLWVWTMLRPIDEAALKHAAGYKHIVLSADEAQLASCIKRAQEYANALEFDASCKAWRSAAKLQPENTDILQSWFEMARHWPAGNDFHTAARMIFQLPGKDDSMRRLHQRIYQTYLEHAQPFVRLEAAHMVQIARSLIRLQCMDEAEPLCRILERNHPTHPALGALFTLLADAWTRNEQPGKALLWQQSLQRLPVSDARSSP